MNLSLPDLVLLGTLATYRLTAMLSGEEGPGHIFARLRTRLGVKVDQYSNPYGTNWVAEGVLCFYCLSVWIGIGVGLLLVAAWLLHGIEIAVFLLLPLALSGGAVFLKKWAG